MAGMFEYYKLNNYDFALQLKGMESMYVWNIYKQLSYDILEKCQDMKYTDILDEFKN